MGSRPANPLLASRLAAAAIAVAALAIYANTFSNGFVFLDTADIVGNATIRHLSELGRVLAPPAAGGLTVGGRPLVNFTLALNYAVSGVDPWSYHLANALIHLGAGLALFGVVRRTPPRSTLFAFSVALLWTVHPLQTEAVSYVVQRAESLMGLLYLLTLYGFIRYTEAPAERRWAVLAVLSCFLGMATKEVMVSAPVIVFLYDRTFVSGSFAAAWRRHRAVLLGLAASWLVVVGLTLGAGERGGTAGFGVGVSWGDYLLTQFPAVLHYLRLAAWPHPLVFDYGAHWFNGLGEVLPAAVAVVGLAVLTLVALWRWPVAGFLGFVFFSILAPTSLVPGISQTLAEHRMYLALGPLVIAFIWAMQRWLEPRVELAVVLLLASVFGLLTVSRNEDYRSDLTLWTDTVAKLPDQARGHYNLGVALGDAGRATAGLEELQEALRLNPNYPEAYDSIGIILAKSGRGPEAIADYAEALRLRPRFSDAHYNLGTALGVAGRYDEAVAEFRAALRIQPEFAEAEDNLGEALARMGQFGEALPHFAKAVALKPEEAKFYFDWAAALQGAGQAAEAIARYEEALRLKPAYAEAHTNLGVALASADRLSEAIGHFEKATQINPNSVNAHYNLAGALTNAGRLPEAIAEYERVLRLNPGYADAHANLGLVLRAAGRSGEADAQAAEAERLKAAAAGGPP